MQFFCGSESNIFRICDVLYVAGTNYCDCILLRIHFCDISQEVVFTELNHQDAKHCNFTVERDVLGPVHT